MTRQHLLQTAAIVLTILTALPAVNSCQRTSNPAAAETTSASAPETSEVTTAPDEGREQIKDGLPETMDLGGRSFSVFVPTGQRCNDFMEGNADLTGDIVNDAVLARNLAVEERLNMELQYFPQEQVTVSNFEKAIFKLLMAGDSTYDIYCGFQHAFTKLLANGGLYNVDDLDDIDLTKPWWWKNYMDELTLNYDRHYFLVGDYFIQSLRFIRVLLFNKDLYAQHFDNADALYQTVLDGKWTIDRLAQLSKDVYADLNNDGKTDENDQLGFISWSTFASTDPFVYGSGVDFTKRGPNGEVILTMISDDAVTLSEKLTDFFWQPGTFTGCTSDLMQETMFASGRVLFLGNSNLFTAENLRSMENAFGVLPYPKLDETQEDYRAIVHDGTLIGALNGSSLNINIAGTVLEALASETYRTVIPAWYEDALKIKYARDDISSQMIDMIHSSASTNFIYAYNYALEGIGLVYRGLVTEKSKDYVSAVEKIEKKAQTKLDTLSEVFSSNS